MSDDPRVQLLLDELLDSDATPEVVCAPYPELLPVVRERWRQMCRLRADLDVLFPSRDATTRQPVEDVALPQVPGYEVEAVLGRGGMGIVFRARHLRLNRLVALKMALADAYAERRERVRFQREAEAAAGLRHPNIVHVYDVGEADGRPYFTMELVDGGSLARKLAGTPQPARQAAQLVATLAGAVQAAHTCGIVHRDLKPANILLTVDDTPKIGDFGVARRLDDGAGLTQTGVPIGTPSYMAPEQARGQRNAVGPAVDVYALGVILYELLTGRPPFRAETAAATLQQVLADEPMPPSRLMPRLPRDLETICLKCLEKDSGKRYPTAAELAADLERFLKHEPIQARPPRRPERCLRWVRRRPLTASLLAAGILLVAAGAVGGWLLHQRRVAADARQTQIDLKVREVVERARGPLEEGWPAADLAKLTEARAEGNRAVDIARSGAASAAVQQEAEAFQADAALRLDRAGKDRELLDELLDISAPREINPYVRDKGGRGRVPAQPSEDEQYAAAFRRWGLDVDATAEAEAAAQLRREPDVVVQEVIASLDAWLLARRFVGRPGAEWRHLLRLAEDLDRGERHRALRAYLVEGWPPRAEIVAALVGAGSPWPALWELARDNARRSLPEVRRDIDPRTAPVLTVLLLARALAVNGNVAAAAEVLDQAATAHPEQVVLLNALGKLLERQGQARLEEAIGYYRAARVQRPSLGVTLSEALARAGRPKQGEDVLKELALQQPNHPAIYFHLGVNLWGQGKYGAAEAACRKAIDLKPDYAQAYSILGNALEGQGRHGDAAAAFHKAIDLVPDFPEAYNDLGIVLLAWGKANKAEAAFRKAIDLKPDSAEPHLNLGNALHERHRYGAAEAAYRRAIDLKPDYAGAYNNLGNVLYAQGRYQEAATAYGKAIALQPDYAETHNNLGNALFRQGRYDEAVTAYGRAIALQPDYAGAHDNLGNALYEQQRYAEAEAAYRKATELKPDFGLAHYDLGCALMELARFHEAAASLKKGADLLSEGTPKREEARQLQQQCRRLAVLNDRLPMILKGTEKPANSSEQTEFAQLCCFKKLYAAGARLYADAFAMMPQLAEELRAGYRYNAACAAALAAAGAGPDGARLGGSERARLRRQALAWLRADLALRTRQQRGGQSLGGALTIWQTEAALSGVRDRAALATLPADERESWQRLWADVAALRAADPLVPLEQGRTHAARRQWAQAAACYAQALKRGPTDDGHFWFEYAALLLLSGDRPGYARACAHMIEHCGKDGGPRFYHVARACTLAPGAVAEAALPGRLADRELQASAREFWSLTEQGALAYRAGRFQRAVPLFEQSLDADAKSGRAALNWLWLALANQRLGKSEEARRWLGKAQAWLDQYRDGMPARAEEELGLHYHNWLEAHVLRREAEAQLARR
jgi:serine/threonine-protein kinase